MKLCRSFGNGKTTLHVNIMPRLRAESFAVIRFDGKGMEVEATEFEIHAKISNSKYS